MSYPFRSLQWWLPILSSPDRDGLVLIIPYRSLYAWILYAYHAHTVCLSNKGTKSFIKDGLCRVGNPYPESDQFLDSEFESVIQIQKVKKWRLVQARFLLIKKTFKNIARISNQRINSLFFEGHFCKNPNPNTAQKLSGLPTLRSSIMQGQG